MTLFLALLLSFAYAQPAPAQTSESNLEQLYREAGIRDAEALRQAYDKLHKPLYQQAYDDYLRDLEYIAQHGTVPDNEALYKDILMMNSNTPFIYSQTEADRHRFFNTY